MIQPRRPSESYNGSHGDLVFILIYFFPFDFKETVFSVPLIALTLDADGIHPEINEICEPLIYFP